MNLSESMRHYASIVEAVGDQYITRSIQNWNKLVARGVDTPPKDPRDGLSPDQPPQADWTASRTSRWLMQYGDTKLINKWTRAQPYELNFLPSVSIMSKEDNWSYLVRYYWILREAAKLAEGKDEAAHRLLDSQLKPVQASYQSKRDAIKRREYLQYDMKAKTEREWAGMNSGEDGDLNWD